MPLAANVNFAQQSKRSSPPRAAAKDVDPLALQILRAVAEPVQQAQQFPVKALVSEEKLATDGHTYPDDPKKDIVTLTNGFAALPDGTSYLQQTALDAKSKQIQDDYELELQPCRPVSR
jgi:hypothetical protein